MVDVSVARQALIVAATSYAEAKYSYLDNIVGLRFAAGTLDRKTIEQINGWLTENPPPPLESSPQ